MASSTSSPAVLSIFDSHLTMSDHQQHQYSQARHIGHQDQPRSYQVIKAATALTTAGSLLVLSALILAGTVVLLTVATPPLVIFSPVLVPAVITVGLILTGFLSSGGFGVAAVTVLSWIYRYMTGKHPAGADQLDQVRMKLAGKTREMKDRAEQFGQQHLYGQQQHQAS